MRKRFESRTSLRPRTGALRFMGARRDQSSGWSLLGGEGRREGGLSSVHFLSSIPLKTARNRIRTGHLLCWQFLHLALWNAYYNGEGSRRSDKNSPECDRPRPQERRAFRKRRAGRRSCAVGSFCARGRAHSDPLRLRRVGWIRVHPWLNHIPFSGVRLDEPDARPRSSCGGHGPGTAPRGRCGIRYGVPVFAPDGRKVTW